MGFGELNLTIHAKSLIAAAGAQAYLREEYAKADLDTFLHSERADMGGITQRPFLPERLSVDVRHSSRTTGSLFFDYGSHHVQEKALVVFIEYENGTRDARLVEIPDFVKKTELTVTFE